MKHTFYLKNSQRTSGTDNDSLIYFSCYFKEESKKFVYSTGENIKPSQWSFENNGPKLKGTKKSSFSSSIYMQLNRYTEAFENLVERSKKTSELITSEKLRNHFNDTFKKVTTKRESFFDYYDLFTKDNISQKKWKLATIKRFQNIKNLLIDFEENNKTHLHFNMINERFYIDFTEFCYNTRGHYTNTFARNLGLFKTFMIWSLDKNYHYNDDFKKFVKPQKTLTQELALELEDIETILNHKFNSLALCKVRDVFVFQCLTGLRYGELKTLGKRNVINGRIILKEEKDVNKQERIIPLAPAAEIILKKYNFELPLISNQKQNAAIKKIVAKAGLDHDVQFTRVRGVEQTVIETTFDKRISTHTARRTFITIMKNKGIADKTIMEMTGHKDFKTFNSYYKVSSKEKDKAVNNVFGGMRVNVLKKVE